MNAHAMIVTEAAPDVRPRSAVSTGVGLAGLAGLFGWILIARYYGMDGPLSALTGVICCGVPMVLWSLLVDKVHRNPSTGIDWSAAPRPMRETIDISLVKIAGLWATWGAIAVFYCVGRWYWSGSYLFAMEVLVTLAPILAVTSVPYVIWIDRRLVEPRDGAHAFGQFLIGQGVPDRTVLYDHFRAWAVKGFFSAFMISIVPGAFGDLVREPLAAMVASPVMLAGWLITAMFVVDIAFATVGYVLTMKPLDSHIRSANPYAAGWMAALICYPPFIMMGDGGPLDYHIGTAEWSDWLAGYPSVVAAYGAVLVGLTAIYAWATVAFGLRFSNLTHRGVLTHGPYAWTKHPAYLAKNSFWWLSTLPFLATTGSPIDAVRNTLLMAAVSGVYYWRARTEEKHLGADPAYRAYAEWMDRNAPIPRLIRGITGRGR
ncbi:MAG: methyltransferase family protein [Sphingobium sp.]